MTWITWPIRLASFALWYAKVFAIANVKVVHDNLTHHMLARPGIARFETQCRTDLEITFLAALITLSPGTLTLGTERVGPDRRRVLLVHGMYAADAGSLRLEIATLEERMLKAMRRKATDS
jgi:multicomponent Na+:H+ antiporter subunit E